MSAASIQVIAAYESLPVQEKQLVVKEILRRLPPFDSGALDDEEVALAGDHLAARLRRRNMVLKRGEVWLFDCGMVEKVRPVLIFSIPFADTDRAVVTVIFHTTALRGSQFEIRLQIAFLKDGAFVAQSVATYPTARAIRKLGDLSPAQFSTVEDRAVFRWLGK